MARALRFSIRWKLLVWTVGSGLALAAVGAFLMGEWPASPSNRLARIGLGFGLAGGLGLAIYWAGERLTQPLREMTSAIERLGGGDFSARVEPSERRDEVGDLTRVFNASMGELELRVDELTHADVARELVEGEMLAARKIQARLLPRRFPAYPERKEFDLYGVNAPSRHVGGDFFDYLLSADDELILVIGDVSGKGVPAAMLMAVSRTIVHNLAKTGLAPARILAEANRLLVEDSTGSMFVTLFVARYNIRTGELEYANGAHLPPFKVTTDNQVHRIGEATGTLVGIMGDSSFEQGVERLEVGELLVLYTDGITEARSPGGDFYGDGPMCRLLSAYSDAPPRFLCDLIVREANAFQSGERGDDITLLMLRRLE